VDLMLSFSISYWDLVKCLYFADTTEREDRGWKEAQRQGEDRVTLRITLLFSINLSQMPVKVHLEYSHLIWVKTQEHCGRERCGYGVSKLGKLHWTGGSVCNCDRYCCIGKTCCETHDSWFHFDICWKCVATRSNPKKSEMLSTSNKSNTDATYELSVSR
jgi:hypothetical protein